MRAKPKISVRQIVTIAMLCAAAYVLVAVIRIPVIMFLDYEPKDVIITIGAFLMGPLTGFVISLVVSLIEMVTISDTGIIGFLMNVISTCAFTCTAAYVYKKNRSMKGATVGLFLGVIAMTAMMLLWNYIITPFYMGVPRSEVVGLLVPAILPFNLLKAGINLALTILFYKPVVEALRKSKLMPPSQSEKNGRKINAGFMLFALILLATCVLLILSIRGII